MNKIITTSLLLVLPLSLIAKKPPVYEKASKSCPAYNNMKHTSNTNNINLKIGTEYRILQKNKGQILTLISGERIAQRWVDDACFSEAKLETKTEKKTLPSILKRFSSKSKESKLVNSKSKQNLLALSWQNAFCQSHQYKKECKAMKNNDFGAKEFVLHGLWPQPRNNQYCKMSKKEVGMDKNKQWHRLSKLDLNTTTRTELAKYMPGYGSNLHKHEWVKHGSCYGTSANDYYANAISLLKQLNESKVQAYFADNLRKTVYLRDIRRLFDSEFGKGAGEHVTMNCRKGLVTELWLHIGNEGDNLSELFKKGERPRSRCSKGRVDAVGF